MDPMAAANMAVEGIKHSADKLVAEVSDAVYNAPGNDQRVYNVHLNIIPSLPIPCNEQQT